MADTHDRTAGDESKGMTVRVVEAHALEQRRGKRKILHGLSFGIGEGTTGLLGPNGAGKTTLLETLCTLLRPTTGSLTVLGLSAARRYDRAQLRASIGFLPQNFGYQPSFSVRDHVEYAAWSKGLGAREVREAARAAIASVGLEKETGRPLKALSGGMLRRAGIAASLVHRPRLLILDEPTVGLDPGQRTGFRELLRTVGESCAVVLSTHLTEDIAAVCDRVIVLDEGRIAHEGTTASLARLTGERVIGPGTAPELERGYNTVVGPRD
ncbi:ATP-binding cassette domain-containing protein [Streptomyces sp. NPDC091212]|uniref:ATP-binding cassette domain-containing protein n=1 Tax=Streptomyces sp. NPDC091212 TaxID=3155191 RepID=UPI00343706F2